MIQNAPVKQRLLGSGKLWRLRSRIRKLLHLQQPREIIREASVYVGCGDKVREGYLGCDIRPLPNVQIVCPAWELSLHCSDLNRIYSRHMCEHLTLEEAKLTFQDWHQALAVGGEVEIQVPNMRFHIEQWLNADWTEAAFAERKSNARWGFAGFYGWQRECDPTREDYNQSYWDVHKSGYDQKLLRFLLEEAGFVDVETRIENDWNLIGVGSKTIRRGERQVAHQIEQVRPDHRARYQLVADTLSGEETILDIACGIGYGCQMMSEKTKGRLLGVDVNESTIEFAKNHFAGPNISYRPGNAMDSDWVQNENFDVATSFETIEHLEDPAPFLKNLARALKSGGRLFCSTPNEEVMPWTDKFKFHFRHYRPHDFESLLSEAGFTVVNRVCQNDKQSSDLEPGWNGKYIVAECLKS